MTLKSHDPHHSQGPQDADRDAPRDEQRTGTFLHAPYDWRRPTLRRFKERNWNPHDRGLLTPKDYGWGWTVNLHEALRRFRLWR